MTLLILASTLAAGGIGQATDARLMRFPDIYEDKVVFTYAGDLWLVSSEGGIARKLTNDAGNEYIAKFSPDGKQIAFGASYDGNVDVYVMPSTGGEPKRLTYHNGPDIPVEWSPDGKMILFRSLRNSPFGRYLSYYTVPAAGGTEETHPIQEGGLGTFSPDGKVIAYNRMATENAAWKGYRGGNQSFISFYDASANKYWEMDHDRSAYLWPMWIGDDVYYANDSDGRFNLYSYDVKSKRSTKLTNFKDFDIKWPSAGKSKIIFERDAKLWTYDISGKKVSPVPVMIDSDLEGRRPVYRELGAYTSDITISPSGARVAVEARGELFSVPSEEGITYNFSNTPGARERYLTWSPDGKWLLYASDKTGEYEWYVRKSDLSEPERRVTTGGNNFFEHATWSPDSKSFIYTDSRNTLYIVDVASGAQTKIGPAEFPAYGDAVWSPDSKWLAYGKTDAAGLSSIFLYDIASKKETQVGNGLFHDQNPVFDKDGKYLFFVSFRDWNPSTGLMELSFNFSDGFRIYGYTLHNETPSPFAPKNDVEVIGDPEKERESEPKPIEIEGISDRMFTVPVPAGNYQVLAAGNGKVYYADGPNVKVYDLKGQQSNSIIEGTSHVSFAPKLDKFAYLAGSTAGIAPLQPGQKVGNGRVSLSDVEATNDPQKEWAQSYWEAWRYERDYFWAPNMAGLDWKAIGDRYAKWLPWVASRSDLDYLLRELLGELRTGHSYIAAAPAPGNPAVSTGLLGADYERAADGVRFKKIYRGSKWFSNVTSPLGEPGLNVKEGDYLVAIDGRLVTAKTNVGEYLVGKADKIVELMVNSSAGTVGARKILVRPIADEESLRYASWVNSRYEYVQKKTGGRVAYVYVPNTGEEGVSEFSKMFYPQVEKDAIIVDERFNGGGFIPDFFIETLARTPLMYWTPRNLGDFRSPGAAILGPKVMLINYYAGSGGDAFPYFFRERGLGKLIGTRTWGGLIGIQGFKDLMAGGAVTVPGFASWDVVNGKPKWVVENEGVTPDIVIDNTPDQTRLGNDPQLDKAIAVIMEELRKNPPKRPTKPPYPGGGGQAYNK